MASPVQKLKSTVEPFGTASAPNEAYVSAISWSAVIAGDICGEPRCHLCCSFSERE